MSQRAGEIEQGQADERERAAASPLARTLDSPLGVALLTFAGYGLFVFARLWSFGGDVSRFALASTHFIPAQAAHAVGLAAQTHGYGYDGQFYYLLALDPFSPHAVLPGARFDIAAYRAQRILYPLVVWALSLGGRPALVPIMLVVVNLAVVIAIGAMGALLARRVGVRPLWGLLVAFYPGLLVSVAGDLAEPLAMACALGAILCVLRHPQPRWVWATVLLSLAVLARETTALVALALFLSGQLVNVFNYSHSKAVSRQRTEPATPQETPLAWLVPAGQWRRAVFTGAVPLVVALCWQGVLLLRWGQIGLFSAGGNNLGLPLVGIVEGAVAWSVLWPPLIQALHYVDVAYLLGLAEVTRRQLWGHWRRVDFVAVAWAVSLALTLCLTVYVWDYYWSFLRGAIELAMLSLLLLLTASPRVRKLALAATLALWLLTFIANAPLL
ncbi:MAG TPA: hypothetical protein VFN78_13480 [Ktedonobacterales bacterium]|nr:hypothetical protein [Ktedonobacterales bacterium]